MGVIVLSMVAQACVGRKIVKMSSQAMKKLGNRFPQQTLPWWLLFKDKNIVVQNGRGGAQIAWKSSPLILRFAVAAYNLRQLKYFITTVECGSVAEASRKLYIAQPAISTAIKGLEDSFGVQLLIRHHAQGVSLTPSGARFYRKAQELLRMAKEFEQNALADNDVVAGQIDIGCFETVAPLYLPQLIAGFSALYPGVKIRIRDGEQQELVQGLTSGTLRPGHPLRTRTRRHHPDRTADAGATALCVAAGRPSLCSIQASVAARSVLEPMILLDVQPSRTYFVSLFEELRADAEHRLQLAVDRDGARDGRQGFRLLDSGDQAAFGMHL